MHNADSKTRTAARLQPGSAQAPVHTGGQSAFFQPKLTVNQPGDPYEQEADQVADKVVQRLAENKSAAPSAEQANGQEATPISIQRIPITPIQRSTIQTKCADCDKEEQLQKKEEEDSEVQGKLQRKPIFDSAAEPPDDGGNIQRKADWGAIQMKCAACEQEEQVQRDSDAAAPTPSPDFSSRLQSSKGGGSPLPSDVSSSMGEAMGADFSGVRVHTGSEAAGMSNSIQAQAFTHGSDVYFNEGKYDTGSTDGKRLLAHELVHTVQQGGDIKRKAVEDNPPKAADKISIKEAKAADLKKANDSLTGTFPAKLVSGKEGIELHLTEFTGKNYVRDKDVKWLGTEPTKIVKEDRNTNQREIWKTKVESGVKKLMLQVAGFEPVNGKIYLMKLNKKGKDKSEDPKGQGVAGTFEQLVEDAIVPFWDGKGNEKLMDIEHMVDFQMIGGKADDIRNLMLLDRDTNRKEGWKIHKQLHEHIDTVLIHFRKYFKHLPRSGKTARVSKDLSIFIDKFTPRGKDIDADMWFDEKEMVNKELSPINKDHISITDFSRPKGHFLLMNSGKRASIFLPYKNTSEKIGAWDITIKADEQNETLKSIRIRAFIKDEKGVVTEKKASETGTELSASDTSSFKKKDQDHVYELNDAYMKQSFGAMRQKLAITKLSPIEWTDPEFSGFDVATVGQVKATISLLEGADIKIILKNGEFILRGEMPLAKFANNFPKPFKIDALDLIVEASSTEGLMVGGGIDFSLGNFGSGSVSASVGKSVQVDGQFNFTNKYFDRTQVNFKYADGKWGITGTIGIGEGKVKGIKSASLTVGYADGSFTAAGKALLSVPGLNSIDLAAQFDDKGNFQFVAGATLGKIPGVKAGAVTVIVSSKEGGDIKLGMHGKLQPDLPKGLGMEAELEVSYNDGIFLLQGSATYKKGRITGKIQAGVTNQAIDDKGKPLPGEPKKSDETYIFGYGELTVDLIKGNKSNAKLGVRLTPAGDVLVSGALSLQQIRPFGAPKAWDKKLPPQIDIKIPLIGVPGLSVYLGISGGPYFKFEWDPLVLKELTVTFPETNIEQLETASLGIKGSVGSRARAEAGLAIEAKLGAQVLIANLEGFIRGEAGLALEAEVGGDLSADWSFEKGLIMKEINAKFAVTPKASVRLSGGFRVYLDLWLTTVDLYEKKWTFAEGSVDLSGFALNIGFPIRFDEEGNVKPPESPDDMQVQKPDFGGKDGDAIMDNIMNGDAKKEREAKKRELRAKIHDDMRKSVNDDDFSPSKYAEKLADKYEEDEEMRQFIMNSVEDEVNIMEHEEFDALKNKLRFADIPIKSKMLVVRIFTLFRKRITEMDVMMFQSELENIEIQKQQALAQQQALAAAAAAAQKNKPVDPETLKSPKKALESAKNQPIARGKKDTQRNSAGVAKGSLPSTRTDKAPKPVSENRGKKVQRKENPDTEIQRKENSGTTANHVDTGALPARLNATKGKGMPLPQDTKGSMEAGMGSDFSDVRIHSGSEAAHLSDSIQAQAFTHGSDIYFNKEQYNPENTDGKRLLAHELVHTIQQRSGKMLQRVKSAPSDVERLTHDQLFGISPATGKTLTEFKAYTRRQADWFVEPTLTGPDRNNLWRLLLEMNAGEHIESGAGNLKLSELIALTPPDWDNLASFGRGCLKRETVKIDLAAHPYTLAERLALGHTLTQLENLFTRQVIHETVSEIQLEELKDNVALFTKLSVYQFVFEPHLQRTYQGTGRGVRGPEFEEMLILLRATDVMPFVSLLNKVRNLHRFPLDVLNVIKINYADTSKVYPAQLIALTGNDKAGAFLGAYNELLRNSRINHKTVLFIEGRGSLSEITGLVPTLAATYGQPGAGGVPRLAEVMIGGHGSPQTLGLAGDSTHDESLNVAPPDMGNPADIARYNNSRDLIDALLNSMPPARAHIVYNACLVGVPDPGRTNLVQFTQQRATALSVTANVQGARASTQIPTTLTDASGNFQITYDFDPSAFADALTYVEHGLEPEGLMRNAAEVARTNAITAANTLRIWSPRGTGAGGWWEHMSRVVRDLALDGVPPGGPVDIARLNALVHLGETFFLTYWTPNYGIRVSNFVGNVNPHNQANDAYARVVALPEIGAAANLPQIMGRMIIEQGWMANGSVRQGVFIAFLDANATLTTSMIAAHLDTGTMAPFSGTLFPAGAAATAGRIRLALAWMRNAPNNADVRHFLDSQVVAAGGNPTLTPAVIAQLDGGTADSILEALGRLHALPELGGGGARTLPRANAPLNRRSRKNRILLQGDPYQATVLASVLNVRPQPSLDNTPFAGVNEGDTINVMGFVDDWAGIDHNGRLGFVHRHWITPPP